jgi:predicted transposase YdaD
MSQVIELFKQSAPQEKTEDIMTIAQKLEEIGEQRGMKLGEQRGRKLGEQIGIKLGKQIGEQVGEQLGQVKATQRLVLNLHNLGQSPDFISQATGLSLSEIENITASTKKSFQLALIN